MVSSSLSWESAVVVTLYPDVLGCVASLLKRKKAQDYTLQSKMSANLQWIQGQPINRFKCIIQCISIKFIPCCPVQTRLTLTCTHFFGSLRLPEKFHLGATLLHFDPWHWSSYVHSRDSEFGNLRSLWLIWKEWNAGNKWVRHGNLPWLQFAAGLAFHWQTNGVFPLQIKMKVNFICPLPPYNFFVICADIYKGCMGAFKYINLS